MLAKEGKPATDAVVVVLPTWRSPLPRNLPQSPFTVTQERMQFVPAVDGKPGKVAEVPFHKAGAVLLACHIHGSMGGHIFVTDSPWTAKTGADGMAVLDEVPEGAARIRVWHADQLLEPKPLHVEVGSAPLKATVKLEVVPRRRRS